jgi:hypothetical protein
VCVKASCARHTRERGASRRRALKQVSSSIISELQGSARFLLYTLQGSGGVSRALARHVSRRGKHTRACLGFIHSFSATLRPPIESGEASGPQSSVLRVTSVRTSRSA